MNTALPSKLLAAQHQQIDQGLGGISERTAAPASLAASLKLLREHLYVEEEVLFPTLGKTGLAMAILVMRREHAQMWPLILRVEAACTAGVPVDNTQDDLRKLLQLLAAHNPKEEQTVYAAADRYDLAHPNAPLATAIAAARMPEDWAYPTAPH
ncbi:MAG: hemerythrin domain-containing protein [Acetobacteraceae bacterium]